MPGETDSPGDIISEMGREYPQFLLGYGPVGRRRGRWIAERVNRLDPGLHTVITDDLDEFRAALRQGGDQ